MACSCGKNIEINSNVGYIIKKIHPFEVCPLCAAKHLDYALIKYETNIHRAIANIYLAYRHVNKYFNTEATEIFNLIIAYFNKTLTYDMLESYCEQFHNFASQYIDKDEEFEQHESLNLESSLTGYQRIYINFIAVNELYNFEVGYKDINTPYCIGLLEESTEFTDFEFIKEGIRNVWKTIEEKEKLDSKDILIFAQDMLYREEKDKKLNN